MKNLILTTIMALSSFGASHDFKDSDKVHKLLEHQRADQVAIDKIAKEFAFRHNCPTGMATLDPVGFLMCAPPPQQQPQQAQVSAPASTQQDPKVIEADKKVQEASKKALEDLKK